VLDGGNSLLQNQHLKGDALSNVARLAAFIPSMQYLMSFPQVVDNICQQDMLVGYSAYFFEFGAADCMIGKSTLMAAWSDKGSSNA
jgi:hypothetical protein